MHRSGTAAGFRSFTVHAAASPARNRSSDLSAVTERPRSRPLRREASAADARTASGDRPARDTRKRFWLRVFNWTTLVLALAVTGWLLSRTLARYSLAEMGDAMMAIPAAHLALAGLFAAGSYATLTLFDYMAVRYVGHRLPYPRVAFTSFVSLSIGHSVGLAGLSSGAIRYRYYARWGLSVSEVAKVILFTGLTVTVGLTALAGLALAAAPGLSAKLMHVTAGTALAVGCACLAATAGYVALAWWVERPLKIWRWTLEIPSWRLALGQVAVGALDFAFVSACLHQCLAALADVSYLPVVAVYVAANVATLISHVPGGLGVIESVTLALVPGRQVIGAVIAFRVIYFLIPLAIGATLFLISTLTMRRRR